MPHLADLLWLTLALPAAVETLRVYLDCRRIYRIARANSTDPRDWEIACHDLRTEAVRLAKHGVIIAGVCLTFLDLKQPWRTESRNVAFSIISLLLLINSERDLRFRRRSRRDWQGVP